MVAPVFLFPYANRGYLRGKEIFRDHAGHLLDGTYYYKKK